MRPTSPTPAVRGGGGAAADDVQQLLREQVWSTFATVARPDSRFHWDFSSFIPDFEGSEQCVDQIRALDAWTDSDVVFITPDNSTEHVRRAAMEDGKPFLMTTYGIRRGFLLLDPNDVPPAERSYASTLDGMDRHAKPVTLSQVTDLPQVGLLITGGSAVTHGGVRLGKGHGYFDLEWALLSEIGAVDEASQIIDVVHDCQVVDADVHGEPHDVPVDWIVTPTRTLKAQRGPRSPGRVFWDLLAGTELASVPPVLELAEQRGRVIPEGDAQGPSEDSEE